MEHSGSEDADIKPEGQEVPECSYEPEESSLQLFASFLSHEQQNRDSSVRIVTGIWPRQPRTLDSICGSSRMA